MWFALSRRWFMGKDIINQEIYPVKLDSKELLRECAAVAGLNMENVERVLNGEIISVHEIQEQVRRVHAVGLHSIPQVTLLPTLPRSLPSFAILEVCTCMLPRMTKCVLPDALPGCLTSACV